MLDNDARTYRVTLPPEKTAFMVEVASRLHVIIATTPRGIAFSRRTAEALMRLEDTEDGYLEDAGNGMLLWINGTEYEVHPI